MQHSPPPPPPPSPGYPQRPIYGEMPSQDVPNYLIPSILVTVLCCQLGIVGIIFAAQVDGKLASGDYEGAVAASNQAKRWTIISVGLAVAMWIGMILFYAFLFLVGGFGGTLD